jgi:rubrerythrin
VHDPDARDGALASREDDSSRKHFLRAMGAAGAAGAAGVLLAACGRGDDKQPAAATTKATPKGSTGGDIEILNYALTLEYLEADFYDQVVRSGVVKDRKVADLAKRIGEAEQAHVGALEVAVRGLGGKTATQPKTAFEDVLAGGPKKVLEAAAMVENLGAAAYLGQAGRIQDKKILAAALSIHSVEARHAAAINALVGNDFKGSGPLVGSLPDGAFAKPMPMDKVLEAVQPFIAKA